MHLSIKANKFFGDNPDLIDLSMFNKITSGLIFVKIAHVSSSIFESLKQKQNIVISEHECLLMWYKYENQQSSWEIIKKEFLEWYEVCYLYKIENIVTWDERSIIMKCFRYSSGVLESKIFFIFSLDSILSLEEKFVAKQSNLLLLNLKKSQNFYIFADLIHKYCIKKTIYDSLA